MNLKKLTLVLTISLLMVAFTVSLVFADCFTVLVGKDVSVDGSVMWGHNEMNGGLRNTSYRYVPRMKHEPGDVVKLKNGGTLPEVAETYAYLWLDNTGIEFSDAYFNEWGVATGSDGCGTREDSFDELVARGDIVDGGIGYILRRLVAQRAKTAREGVLIATEVLNQFGYSASGRSLMIVDSNEAWVLAMAAGKRWIAQRVPDDQVVLLPNVHIVGPEADLNDKENVIASPGLIEYAIKRGWYSPDSGKPFSFREAFNRPPSPGSFMEKYGPDPRQWWTQSLVLGKLIELPMKEQLPFSVTPPHKLSVNDVANIMRSHGNMEGQEPILAEGYKLGMPEKISPHLLQDGREAQGMICASSVQEMAVYQLRNWLPTEVGSLVWRTTAAGCGSVLVPWYSGITGTPKPYYKPVDLEQALDVKFHFNPPAGYFNYDPENAFDTFNALENLIDLNYPEDIKMVREVWDPFEAEQFALQPVIEEVAIKLLSEDKDLARQFLTDYTSYRALKALGAAKELVNKLQTIHWSQ